MTDQQFQQVTCGMTIEEKTKEIAYMVLVEGKPQKACCEQYKLSKGTVSIAVSKVKKQYELMNSNGIAISLVLPKDKAQIAEQWSKEFLTTIEKSDA